MKTVKPLKRTDKGFTLIEALIASMLIGLAIAALASSSGAFTMYNAAGLDLSTSEFLIDEIREMTAPLPFDVASPTNFVKIKNDAGSVVATYYTVNDFKNFNTLSLHSPVDTGGASMPEFAAYSQKVTVEYVLPTNLSTHSAATTDFCRVTVTINKGGQAITSTSWIRAKY